MLLRRVLGGPTTDDLRWCRDEEWWPNGEQDPRVGDTAGVEEMELAEVVEYEAYEAFARICSRLPRSSSCCSVNIRYFCMAKPFEWLRVGEAGGVGIMAGDIVLAGM